MNPPFPVAEWTEGEGGRVCIRGWSFAHGDKGLSEINLGRSLGPWAMIRNGVGTPVRIHSREQLTNLGYTPAMFHGWYCCGLRPVLHASA